MCFNPRTHEGCDFKYSISYITSQVSIHAPTRGATGYCRIDTNKFGVSIHAPTRGATGNRPHRERLCLVSIHAPTRGATRSWRRRRESLTVSIHAPTRGATHRPANVRLNVIGFNPRTHEGCDCCFFRSIDKPHGFNPRTHEGCDF